MPGRGGAREGSLLGSSLVDAALSTLPDVDALIEQGFAEIRSRGFTEEKARSEFGKWMVEAHRSVASSHRRAEAHALDRLVDLLIDRDGTLPGTKNDLRRWVRAAAPDLVAFEFRAGQARKSRAGSVWEKIGTRFLEWNGIPCEKPTGKAARSLHQIDKVVPSVAVALETPDRAIRLSFKTEAREKWRVLIDEGRRGHVYLVTLGDDVTPTRLAEMAESRLVVYVPREIKESESVLKSNATLRTLDDLPNDLRRYVPSGPSPPPPLLVAFDPPQDAANEEP
jgi:EcoRII C terminal